MLKVVLIGNVLCHDGADVCDTLLNWLWEGWLIFSRGGLSF